MNDAERIEWDEWAECRFPNCDAAPHNEFRPFCELHWGRLTPELRTTVSEFVRARMLADASWLDLVAECIEKGQVGADRPGGR